MIVEGTFWTRPGRDEFVNHPAADMRPHFVTLRVSLPEALGVAVDITRRSSRDPAVLTACHVAFAATVGALGATELGVDTTTATADQVAEMIAASLEDRSSGERRALFRKGRLCADPGAEL